MRGSDRLAAKIRAAGVRDERVLAAVRSVPRAEFVPPGSASRAYEDVPIEIGHGQVTTQPSLVALMLEALALEGDETVLEIGTGLGYTALLARLARVVLSIERWPGLAADARANLARNDVTNARVVVGDGSAGLPDRAPFAAIVVSAAFPGVPPPLVEQLEPGGRLVHPVGPGGSRGGRAVSTRRAASGAGGHGHRGALRPAVRGSRLRRAVIRCPSRAALPWANVRSIPR